MSAPGNLWRRVHGRATGRPTNFSWVIDGRLAGSGMPTTRAELGWAVARGVSSVVTMTEEPLPAAWTSGVVDYLHVPTPDMDPPAPGGIDSAVSFIHRQIRRGRPAMVHCAAGLGRAGTVLACYHVRHMGCSGPEAVARIRAARPGSIQSESQERAVSEYARRVRGGAQS